MALDLDKLREALGREAVTAAEAARRARQLGALTPAAVLHPGSPEAVAAALHYARERELAVVPWGGGTQQGVGGPPERYDLALSTAELVELVDYQPDDMTVTVRPGMTVADLWSLLAERGQFLPLDPPRPDKATVGGTVAVNASGPLRAGYGTARDWLIGATVATPDGALVKGGGRVVKNVAGYDLCKLWTGSLGTLGVLVEITFKVLPRPEALLFAAAPLDGPERAEALIAAALASDVSPAVLELADAAAWRAATNNQPEAERFVLFAGFFGPAETVAWQRDTFGQQAEAAGTRAYPLDEADGESLLAGLRDYAGEGDLVVRLSVPGSEASRLMEALAREARRRGLAAGLLARATSGTVLARADGVPSADVPALVERWREAVPTGQDGHAAVLRAPAEAVGRYDPWGDPGPSARLMAGIKLALDPENVLNPGRFVDEL